MAQHSSKYFIPTSGAAVRVLQVGAAMFIAVLAGCATKATTGADAGNFLSGGRGGTGGGTDVSKLTGRSDGQGGKSATGGSVGAGGDVASSQGAGGGTNGAGGGTNGAGGIGGSSLSGDSGAAGGQAGGIAGSNGASAGAGGTGAGGTSGAGGVGGGSTAGAGGMGGDSMTGAGGMGGDSMAGVGGAGGDSMAGAGGVGGGSRAGAGGVNGGVAGGADGVGGAGAGGTSGVGGAGARGADGIAGRTGAGARDDMVVGMIDAPGSRSQVDEDVTPQTLGGMLPLTVGVDEEGHFDFDKAVLRPEVKEVLDELVARLDGAQYDRLDIIGYTDRIGNDEYNQSLSERRAWAVARYLIEKGVPLAKMKVEGRGERNSMMLATECADITDRSDLIVCLQKDRRVEIEASIRRSHVKVE